jgi:hypothetical protein
MEMIPKGGYTAPLGGGRRWAYLRRRQGALDEGSSEVIIRIFTDEETLEQTLETWYHFSKPIHKNSEVSYSMGRAIAQAVTRQLPTPGAGFEPRSDRVGFVVGKVELEQDFSEYFCFLCQFSFHRMLHIHHPGLVQQTS